MREKSQRFQKPRQLRKGNCLVVLVIIIALVVLCSGCFTAKAETIAAPAAYIMVKVCAGDTLWSLVEEYYDYPGNIRAAIRQVKEINHLSSSIIYSGQFLYIPAD